MPAADAAGIVYDKIEDQHHAHQAADLEDHQVGALDPQIDGNKGHLGGARRGEGQHGLPQLDMEHLMHHQAHPHTAGHIAQAQDHGGQGQLLHLDDLFPGYAGADTAAGDDLGKAAQPHGHSGALSAQLQSGGDDQGGGQGPRRNAGPLAQGRRRHRRAHGRQKRPQRRPAPRPLPLMLLHRLGLHPPGGLRLNKAVGEHNHTGQTAHPKNHPHKLHHRHHRAVRPHVHGDKGRIRHPPGGGTEQAGQQIQVGDAVKDGGHSQIQLQQTGQHHQIGPDEPGQVAHILPGHHTADIGPGEGLGHNPGLGIDEGLSGGHIQRRCPQNGPHQHSAGDPQFKHQQAHHQGRQHRQHHPHSRNTPFSPRPQPKISMRMGMVTKLARMDRQAPVAAYSSSAP